MVKITLEEYGGIREGIRKLFESKARGKIDKITCNKKVKQYIKRVKEADNYFEFSKFEDYRKNLICIAIDNFKSLSDTYKMLEHERKHAEVAEKYGLSVKYCFICDNGEVFPFIYLDNILELSKNWDAEKEFRVDIETRLAVDDLSGSDIQDLEYDKILIKLHKDLNEYTKKELIGIIDNRLRT